MDNDATPETLSKPARMVIVDDHDLVREGLQRMFSREPEIEVVGEAANGREAIEMCREVRPDLVLMDVRMPEMDGMEATRRIKQALPNTSILMLTTYDNPDYLMEAVEAGAAGYLLKDAPKHNLMNAVRRTLGGDSPLNQELAMELIRRFARKPSEPEQPPKPDPSLGSSAALKEGLTRRETEVLQLLAQGKSNPRIAEELVISRGTAKVHVQRIIVKLGVSDRTQAAVRAIELGIVTPNTRR